LKQPSASEYAAEAPAGDAPDKPAGPDRPSIRLAPEPADKTDQDDSDGALSRLRVPLMVGGVVVVLAAGGFFWLTSGRYQTTDDAYVRVAGVDVSSNVAGRVVEVDVKENQRVHTGDVLFRIDPAPFQIAVDQAQAEVADARQRLEADLAAYRQKLADQSNAQNNAAYTERERKREQGLLEAGAVSQAEYDQSVRTADAARLQVATAQAASASALANLGGRADQSPEAHPAVRQAEAQLARARLQLSWTVIHAPQEGKVTKVEQLQVGDYINASTPVFHLVADRVWVEAAFKENQLTHMCTGLPATVSVDAYPGHTLEARVASVAPGTDQTFAMMPAENASGNWVKVVQRLPVRLEFAKAPPIELQGGLSAKVKVDTGFKRGLFGGAHGTCR
jgi:membrane fusion protein (multidrug efflux system)